MGSSHSHSHSHSHSQSRSRSASTPGHDYNGPLFGGHYAGDFSIRADVNKPLPPTPQSKTVRFAADPPPWEFYKNRPSDENTYNTRYCSPPAAEVSASTSPSARSPPPAYGTWDEKILTVRNP
ncbi:hypothetical protein IAU59_004087 [Kwoniella sp. CBS 9459]